MTVLDEIIVADSGALAEYPGHRYRLYNVEDNDYQVIRLFMNLSGLSNSGVKNGTTVEEIIRVLLDYFDTMECLHPNKKNALIRAKLVEIIEEL